MAAAKKIFFGYQKRINANTDAGQKTLTVVYYSGHGMMDDNHSQIVMPDPKSKKPLYNLEARLRALGNLGNSFVIGILDCCRDPFNQSIFPP